VLEAAEMYGKKEMWSNRAGQVRDGQRPELKRVKQTDSTNY